MQVNIIDEGYPLVMDDNGQFKCAHNIDRVMVTRNQDGTFSVDCFDCHNEDLQQYQIDNFVDIFVDQQGGWDE